MKSNLKTELTPELYGANSLHSASRRGIKWGLSWTQKNGWDLDRQKEVGRVFQVQGTA